MIKSSLFLFKIHYGYRNAASLPTPRLHFNTSVFSKVIREMLTIKYTLSNLSISFILYKDYANFLWHRMFFSLPNITHISDVPTCFDIQYVTEVAMATYSPRPWPTIQPINSPALRYHFLEVTRHTDSLGRFARNKHAACTCNSNWRLTALLDTLHAGAAELAAFPFFIVL